jgi:hypothetical protein
MAGMFNVCPDAELQRKTDLQPCGSWQRKCFAREQAGNTLAPSPLLRDPS